MGIAHNSVSLAACGPNDDQGLPDVKQKIVEMTLNGSGIRDTARVLKISPTTVINELKKKEGE